MNRLTTVTLSVAVIALAGCSKALTESSASGVIQKWIDSQAGGVVSTFAGALTSQIGVEQPQHWTVAGVQRAIKEGYLQERTVTVTYPNFSGEFTSGIYPLPGQSSAAGTDLVVMTMRTTSERPPRVSGFFKICRWNDIPQGPYNSCQTGNVNGIASKTGGGASNLSLTVTAENGFTTLEQAKLPVPPLSPLPPQLQRNIPFQASMVRADPDVVNAVINGIPVVLRGHATGQDVRQDVYSYNWTDKLPKDSINGAMLRLGHLVVESCGHLLLGSETVASASCKTHVKLTSAAESIFGSRPTDQTMQASFGKQPDGTWVGTGINYSAPQYNIFQ
jgi:hypothetical protein